MTAGNGTREALKRKLAANVRRMGRLRAVTIPPPLMSAVVMADAVTRRLNGVLGWRPEPTLRTPLGQVAGAHFVVPVYIEVVGLLHERETFVQPLRETTLAASQLDASPVEPYVAVFVLHQMVSVVAVHKLLFEETGGLSLCLVACLCTRNDFILLLLE